MKEIIGQYVGELIIGTILLYIALLFINILIKASTGEKQKEPNIFYCSLIVVFVDIIHFLYSII